ncbi:MAG: helix-turn-helix transcriptional regulator [Pseudodonghicola sp.]
MVRAEPLITTLRSQTLRPARGPYESFTHLLVIDQGDVVIGRDDSHHDAQGPAAVILPPNPAALVTCEAGSSGWLLGLNEPAMTDMLGASAEAELLAPVLRQFVVVGNYDLSGIEPVALARRIADEIASGGPGSYLAIQSCIRVLLIDIWRHGSFQAPVLGQGSEMQILYAFRQLVERHFRSHRTVRDYAADLGISYERLHRICRRHLQRPPLRLIQQRMMREATIWLERSGKPIEEIAYSLGFADASEFSHFFKRNSGLAPSIYRARIRNRSEASRMAARSFADWP